MKSRALSSELLRDELDTMRVRLIGEAVLKTVDQKALRGRFGFVDFSSEGALAPVTHIAGFTDLRVALIETMRADHIDVHAIWEEKDKELLSELTVEHLRRAGANNSAYAKAIIERDTPYPGLERVMHGIGTMAEMYVGLLETIHLDYGYLSQEERVLIAQNSFGVLQKLMALYLYDFENYTRYFTEKTPEGRVLFSPRALTLEKETSTLQFANGGLFKQIAKAPVFTTRHAVDGNTKKCPALRIDSDMLKKLWQQCIAAATESNLL